MAAAVSINSLTRRFKKLTAVDGISFEIAKGELFGFLGPNGAGKTTTINMLSTLLKPTSGTALVNGYDIMKERDHVRSSIGIVFQEPALDGRLTGRENLEFHALMYGMARAERLSRIKEVLELVELSDKSGVRVDQFSGGMKRRLEIARGLMHRPDVLFLDEPTIGLDSQTRRHIWDYVRRLKTETGITIILTTHYMDEADVLSDRICIMDKGQLVALDTPARLKDVLGGDVIELAAEGDCAGYVEYLNTRGDIRTVKTHGCSLSLTLEQGDRKIPELLQAAGNHKLTITSVNLRKPSLDDVFLYYTGKTIREGDINDNKPAGGTR